MSIDSAVVMNPRLKSCKVKGTFDSAAIEATCFFGSVRCPSLPFPGNTHSLSEYFFRSLSILHKELLPDR